MQGVPLGFEHAADRAEFRAMSHRAGLELFRARIVRYAFEPHTHAAYGVGVINAGAERFRYRGSEHLAGAGSLVLMNPDELHTGRAGVEAGWSYRMLYLDVSALAQISGSADVWSFRSAVVDDPHRAQRLDRLLQQLWQGGEALAQDEALARLVDLLRPWAHTGRAARPEGMARFEGVIEHMQEHLDQRLRLDDLARVAGLSPFHFLRSFAQRHHATPHQMLMALRLLRAKQQLAAGQTPAQVAAAVGLADQAHLTRAFVQRYGVTPARYQQQARPQSGSRRRGSQG
jgi:AraC-like DNA-binding protein